MAKFTGKLITDMSDKDYRKTEGLANSSALLIERNAADYIWSMKAPFDEDKRKTANIGTLVHGAILEPKRFESMYVESAFKSRTTKGFEKEVEENQSKIVMLADEIKQVKLMQGSVMAHPVAELLVSSEGPTECSVFTTCTETGVKLKIRPDKLAVESLGICADVKTTDDIEAWRSNKRWINPLFKFNYGHQAAFYLHALSCYYGYPVDEFSFIVVQKKSEFGRYPVTVITITSDELRALGFFDRVLENIKKFKRLQETGDYIEVETFNFD